jgi:hypothetical protein
MGIRIKKSMGWGIVLPHNEDFEERVSEALEQDHDDYVQFLKDKYKDESAEQAIAQLGTPLYNMDRLAIFNDALKPKHRYKKTLDAYDAVTFETEYVNENEDMVLIVSPFSVTSAWNRYDDSIDYAEALLKMEDDGRTDMIENTIRYLPHNQYPYDGQYMHEVTGESVSQDARMVMRYAKAVLESLAEKDQLNHADTIEFLRRTDVKIQNEGFASYEDLKAHMVPLVPQDVRDVCEWLEIFDDERAVLELRPMLLTHWG